VLAWDCRVRCSRVSACVKYTASGLCEDDAHREGEVREVLEKDRHGSAEVSESKDFDVTVVDKNHAFCWIVDTGDKVQYCTLSRAIRSDNNLQ